MNPFMASPVPSPTTATPRPSSAVHRSEGSIASGRLERSSRASDEDSKTSVKVAIRIRPPLKPSDPGFELIPQRFQRSMVQNTSQSSLAVDSPQGRKLFVFDRVFGGDVGQDGIFDYIQPSIDAFMQGYNVSIMAYGQSGAGKSHTMGTSGPAEQGDRQLMGIIPRAATSLFSKLLDGPNPPRGGSSGLKAPQRYNNSVSPAPGALNGKAADRDWQLKATYLEIYNEQLRDLLIPAETPADMKPSPTIREDKGKILLTGLTQIDINSTEDLLNALNHGSTIRQTDATAINARSSRSHAIFSLNLVQKRPRSPEATTKDKRAPLSTEPLTESFITTDSKLHFVDLAGSERLKNTGASGDRAKEGIAINAGLASLGKVISQLSSRNQGAHVSYRDSKLTRILQDSLGGNAITYLVACVTPAEFHLSETLNTVQYAQRARAIQSKPQIQHINEEGDKQAIIDRLRAEISFLRDQIKIAQNTNGVDGPVERSDQREAELQEQLLGVQESYGELSKRHARLIAEISKAGKEAEQSLALGATPAERIERANSMNKVIDQVVSEYEETIATLQAQMRDNRAALDTSENKVMENESKLAYVQKVNEQLSGRAQKFMDRESSLESYVRDLESRLDGRISTDDRNSELLADLRKQIDKMRDAEVSSDEYIANLEERLAEAEQDMELMNREINRLENVVERQRSVGRLDSLIMELNNIQKKGEAAAITEKLASTNTNGHVSDGEFVSGAGDDDAFNLAAKTPLPAASGASETASVNGSKSALSITASPVIADPPVHSPTQMQFVEEKLDAVNQELVALRVEHESTVTEYDILAEKYQEALRTLAALQQAADREDDNDVSGTAFANKAGANETKKEGVQHSVTQSVSSVYSSDAASPTVANVSNQLSEALEGEFGIRSTPATSISSLQFRPLSNISENGLNIRSLQQSVEVKDQVIAKEVEALKSLSVRKDGQIEELSVELDSLRMEHDKALEAIAGLKADVQRAKTSSPASPTNFVRRKSGHSALGTDRTNRAFVSLGNIATEYLEEQPDARENFQIQLAALSNEMQSRGDRVEALELEVTNAKKEMEAKMQIISGLARERSSIIAASPVDVSVVSTMREKLVQNENQIMALQDQLGSRERELSKEILALKAALDEKAGVTRDPDATTSLDAVNDLANERNQEMIKLREEIAGLQAGGRKYVETINELEETLSSVDTLRQEKAAEAEDNARIAAAATAALDLERQKLTDELIQQKSTIETHATRFDALQQAYESLQRDLTDHSGLSEASIAQLENHRAQIDQLELHLQSQYDAIEEYKETIEEMAKSHARELDDMQALIDEHDLEASKDGVIGENGDFELRKRLATSEAARVLAESTIGDVQARVDALSTLERQLKQENDQLRQQHQRSSRYIEELEGQSSSRLSAVRRGSQQEITDARSAALKAQQEIVELQARLQMLERAGTPIQPERANSMASRKSIGIGALPSPPPAMPLPPLPANVPQSPMVATFSAADGRPKSPPTSMKRDSTTQMTIQEQEARIRTVEKHLNAEKQLTATLEEALTDLEKQGEKLAKESESWRARAQKLEAELGQIRQERTASARMSQQVVEDARQKQELAEKAQAELNLKMDLLKKQTKKKGGFNCFA